MATENLRFRVWAAMAIFAVAQGQDTTAPSTRTLQNQAIIELRKQPPGAQVAATAVSLVNSAVRKEGPPGVSKPDDNFVGLNLWKMVVAPPTAPVKSRGFRHPVEDPYGTLLWTAQRLTLDRPVRENDWIRFSFESPRKGYIYVIDRDVFAGGKRGEPTLIFPTTRLRGGRNDVAPGSLVQIPDPADRLPALRVEMAKANQTGIQLIIIVTQQPIPEIVVAGDKQVLPEALLSRWESQWAGDVEASDDPALNGLLETAAENAAVRDPAGKLGSSDHTPVTLFHRRGHGGEPIFAQALIKLERMD